MTVKELNRDQMIQLKQDYLCETRGDVSYGELADADEIVSDEQMFDYYGGIDFVEDDFWSKN